MESLFLLSKGRNGAEDSASAGKFLWRLCFDPMNNFNCDRVRGGFSVSISSFFRAKVVIPLGVILWPNHLHSPYKNLDFVFETCSLIQFF